MSSTGGYQVNTQGLVIGQIRLHDGLLTPDEVLYNYALDAVYYRGASLAASVSPLPTPSPSPNPALTCPTTWGINPTQ